MELDWFNLTEAGFWFLLAAVCAYLYRNSPKRYANLALFSAVVLFTFGVSDLVQVHYGSFLIPGLEWLYVWKVLNVAAIALAIVWYLYLRLTQSRSMAKSIDTGQ